jgi:hypothetical protein
VASTIHQSLDGGGDTKTWVGKNGPVEQPTQLKDIELMYIAFDVLYDTDHSAGGVLRSHTRPASNHLLLLLLRAST